MDLDAQRSLIRMFLFSLCLAVIGMVVLSFVTLLLPPSWYLKGIPVVGVLVGSMLALLIYAIWGSASCLADVDVWCTALLTVVGIALIRFSVCALQSQAKLLNVDLPTICTLGNSRAVVYGSSLTVLGGTFSIWLVVRYLTWSKR